MVNSSKYECGSFVVEKELKIPSQTPLSHLRQGKGLNEAAGYISSPEEFFCLLFLFCYSYFTSFWCVSPTLGTIGNWQAQWEHRIRASAELRSSDLHLLPKLQS